MTRHQKSVTPYQIYLKLQQVSAVQLWAVEQWLRTELCVTSELSNQHAPSVST